ETMSHEELVNRVLEMQDMMREGLAVRDSLHAVLNTVLNAKADEVARFADAPDASLDPEELELKKAWAAARHAVSNPMGAARKRAQASAANCPNGSMPGRGSDAVGHAWTLSRTVRRSGAPVDGSPLLAELLGQA